MAQKFDRMKDGYNRYQVDLAMEELDMRIDNLQRINEAYRTAARLEEQIRYLESVYSPAFQNLRQKEDAASQMVAIAMKEANTIVSTAKQNADVIIGEALLNAREMLADITHLAQETQDAKGTMKRQTQRSRLLDEFERVPVPGTDLLNEKAMKKTCPLTASIESRWLVEICDAGERKSLWS